jgi:salicylate hydroxylase
MTGLGPDLGSDLGPHLGPHLGPNRAPILVAGGGIGGLALALALARQGVRSVVLERQAEPTAAGAGIQLGPNGVRALQQLGLKSALEPLVGTPSALIVYQGRTGRPLATLPLGAFVAARHRAPYWVAHRGDVHAALVAAAARTPLIGLRTGFAVGDVRLGGAGVEVLSIAGKLASGSALVGADGLWSRVRACVCPVVPTFAGATATRTVLPAACAGRLAQMSLGLWLTPGVHVVHYPVRAGSEVAVVVIATEDWRGREWDTVADPEALLRRLGGFHQSLREVLSRAQTWRKWALFSLSALPSWVAGRVVLMGDAAHAMLPYLAQGGALALEDALVLADCLAELPGDEIAALARFSALRRARALRVERASRRQGRIYHLSPPFAWARDLALRMLPGSLLMARLDWLYDWGAKS